MVNKSFKKSYARCKMPNQMISCWQWNSVLSDGVFVARLEDTGGIPH